MANRPEIKTQTVSHMYVLKGRSLSADYVAAQIYDIWVEDSVRDLWKFFVKFVPQATTSQKERFATKAKVYCEASTLRILLMRAVKEKCYTELVLAFGKLLPLAPNSEGSIKLEAIKSAMLDLDQEKKEFSWARSWFAEIGHDETNPATLITLIQLLMHTAELHKLLSDLVEGT
jgi:hypothetical protein